MTGGCGVNETLHLDGIQEHGPEYTELTAALLEGGIPIGNLHSQQYTFGTIHVEPTNTNRKPSPVAGNTKTNANRMKTMATGPTTIDLTW